ncbi:Adenosine 5'-monophosphoramidase [Spiromyces aspiralis]|uniref:Adenosine 5'-monophosphoramidase n=1 Tax=Spiromyces aspiralis TaxID=68401 RepID=A0ACC1HUF9_9FUNG|nr:Adenosine 5'-monophosphoramidase [Spiromyces aspiralis]
MYDSLIRRIQLVIPKYHAEKMHELPDEYLVDILPQAKRVASALGAENYNILQEVMHVHFHVIPKPSDEKGLVIGWPSEKADPEQLDADTKALVKKLEESV